MLVGAGVGGAGRPEAAATAGGAAGVPNCRSVWIGLCGYFRGGADDFSVGTLESNCKRA